MDWFIIISCFIPLLIFWYANINGFNEAVVILFKISFGSSFGFYLYPSLFLALDRILVVMFPLKFHKYEAKFRILKAVWLGTHFSFMVLNTVVDVMFGFDSFLSQVFEIMQTCIVLFVLLTITALYTTMVVQIIRSSKKMAESQQVGRKEG